MFSRFAFSAPARRGTVTIWATDNEEKSSELLEGPRKVMTPGTKRTSLGPAHHPSAAWILSGW